MEKRMISQEEIGIYIEDSIKHQDCDKQSALRDLLTELRYYAVSNSLDFPKAIEGSMEVYAVENWSLEDRVNLLAEPENVSDTFHSWILYDLQDLGDDVSLDDLTKIRGFSLEDVAIAIHAAWEQGWVERIE
jgi:hypothetical protein